MCPPGNKKTTESCDHEPEKNILEIAMMYTTETGMTRNKVINKESR